MTNFAGAVPGPDGQPLDQIRITGVNARGRHGVLASERATGQEFRADVVLHVDTRPAAEGDDLRATVSYADVAQEVHDVLVGEPVDLIETLAERIAAIALGHSPVQAVDVSVHKPQAPIPVSFTDVEVAIRRDRVVAPPVVGMDAFAAGSAPASRSAAAAEPDAPADESSSPEAGRAEVSQPVSSGYAAPAVDPLTAPIGDVTTDETTPADEPPAPIASAAPATGRPDPAAADAPVSAEDLVVPEIAPAEPARTAGAYEGRSAEFEQAEAPAATQAAPPAERGETRPEDVGMIDGVPPIEHGAPAFEPHADAPARPVDDDSTALRPAYDPAADPAVAQAFAAAPAPETQSPESAPGAEQYQPEQYQREAYQPEFQQDLQQQFQPEQYEAEQYQAEQFQPEQYQAEQGRQAPFAEQAPQAPFADQPQPPAFAGQSQPVFAEQSAPAPGVVHGSAPEDRLDEVPAEPVEVVLALGANLGDPQATLRAAVMDLDRIAGLQITDVSPLARTAAVGGPEQPDYLNAVVVARTGLAPRGLLHACQAIEYAHGRTREEHWGPRSLDIDIITYGALTAAADDLEVPHPRAHERAFVLEPWSQLKPDAVLPGLGGGPVAQLAATAEDRQGIRWLALDWLTESNSGADPTGDVEPQPTASHRPYDPPSQPQAAPPVQDQQAPDRSAHQDPPQRDQLFQGGSGQQPGQGPADPYQQQVRDPFQQMQDAHPHGFGPDSMQHAPVSGSVPPPEEALVPAPHAPVADHPARAPHTPPAAPLVPSAVRETAHHDLSTEPAPVEPVHPVFAPVRPQPGDVPFAPVHPAPVDQQRAPSADDRPAWAPVRTDEHGHG